MHTLKPGELAGYFNALLTPDSAFYRLTIIYTVAISLLTLAVPISVQTLISTVANTALVQSVVVLAVLLLILLTVSGLLTALRTYTMEIFRRRIYARLTSDIVLRAIHSQHQHFEEHNRHAIFNRYFDIMTVQKTMPILLIGGCSLLLQALVGFTVVSLYHPVFLIFNIGIVLLLYLTWRIWGPRAINTGIALSHAKYQTAEWLQQLAENNGFFRSRRHEGYALEKTETLTADYVQAHGKHFRKTFSQTLVLLALYALASASLLGLGGWLVIIGELTLGQLVAAELIMTAIFFGLSQANIYLDNFYDLCAAIEELSLFLRLPLEEAKGSQTIDSKQLAVRFCNVSSATRNNDALHMDLEIPNASYVLANAETHKIQKTFTNLLKRYQQPDQGQILLGDQDITQLQKMELRQAITVLDRLSIVECSINDYLTLANPSSHRAEQREVLAVFGLDQIIDHLPHGWETILTKTATVLSRNQTMYLRLAAAVLSNPRVLVVSDMFDSLDSTTYQSLIQLCMRIRPNMSLIAFTRHVGLSIWTHRLEITHNRSTITAQAPSIVNEQHPHD